MPFAPLFPPVLVLLRLMQPFATSAPSRVPALPPAPALAPAPASAPAPPFAPAPESRPPLARLSGAYIADFAATDARETHAVVLGKGSVGLQVDLARAGMPGTHVLLEVLADEGGSPSGRLGDIQGVDNIEAPHAVHLYEAWIEQVFPRADWSVLAGFYDLNSEFDEADAASVFVNSSFGVGAALGESGRRGPSIFPTTSLGLRLRTAPTVHSYAQLAVLDGVPGPVANGLPSVPLSRNDGVLLVAEAGYLGPAISRGPPVNLPPSQLRLLRAARANGEAPAGSKAALGLWAYTGRLPVPGDATAPSVHGSLGAYAFGETWLRRRPGDPQQGLRAWAQLGISAGRADPVRFFTGAALTYTGLLQSDDVVGLGVATALASAAYRDALERRMQRPGVAETALELTWQLAVGNRLSFQPDFQLVFDPLADSAPRTAGFGGLRVEVSL